MDAAESKLRAQEKAENKAEKAKKKAEEAAAEAAAEAKGFKNVIVDGETYTAELPEKHMEVTHKGLKWAYAQ